MHKSKYHNRKGTCVFIAIILYHKLEKWNAVIQSSKTRDEGSYVEKSL